MTPALGRGTPNALHRADHPHRRSFQRQVEPGPHEGLPVHPSDCRGIQRQLGRLGGHDLLHFPTAIAGQLVVHHDQPISRADEEVNPPDNPLAVVQRCRDGIFSADLAAGPRRANPCRENVAGTGQARAACGTSSGGRLTLGGPLSIRARFSPEIRLK